MTDNDYRNLMLGAIFLALGIFAVCVTAGIYVTKIPTTCTCDNSAKVETNARRY